MEHRVFGAPQPGMTYRDRPGAYGIAFDGQGNAAVVCSARKGCFLLGGGIEPGEDEPACIRREALEETGYAVAVGEKVCVGEEFTADLNGRPYHPIGHVYLLELGKQVSQPVESDHVLTWMPAEEFRKTTFLSYQSWSMEMAWELTQKRKKEKNMTIYDELVARGLIAQVTSEDEVKDLINNGKATFYIGFDCTADSLTAGHFVALTLMKRLQSAGNKPIALIGGGTTMIGDPSGRTDMRKMLTKEDIDHNAECFKRQMERFIDFGEGKAMMVNNADWLLNLNYVELLREVGACFSVNNMLRADCYKQRMERGLSFLEFNYMIMQSYDFYHMFQTIGCNMQCGGNDQWSNMLGGTELIRRKLGKDSHCMTITLLTDSQGNKMGKTAGNAVWLDPNKTSPYDFYQYWRNVGDADVMKCIRLLTFLPLEQIDEMDGWKDAQLNQAKEILAWELTSMVHGREEADKAQAAAKALFSGGGDAGDMPSTELTDADFTDGSIGALTLLVKCGLAASNGEARRLIQQGGVALGDEKMSDPAVKFPKDRFAGEGVIVKKGKKVFHRAVLA